MFLWETTIYIIGLTPGNFQHTNIFKRRSATMADQDICTNGKYMNNNFLMRHVQLILMTFYSHIFSHKYFDLCHSYFAILMHNNPTYNVINLWISNSQIFSLLTTPEQFSSCLKFNLLLEKKGLFSSYNNYGIEWILKSFYLHFQHNFI